MFTCWEHSIPNVLKLTVEFFYHGWIWVHWTILGSATGTFFFMEPKENPHSATYLLEYCLLCMASWLLPLTKPLLFGKHWDSILSWDLHYTVQDLEKAIIAKILCVRAANMHHFPSYMWWLTNLYFVRTNIKNFNNTGNEVPDSFKIWPPDTPWAIHQ